MHVVSQRINQLPVMVRKTVILCGRWYRIAGACMAVGDAWHNVCNTVEPHLNITSEFSPASEIRLPESVPNDAFPHLNVRRK